MEQVVRKSNKENTKPVYGSRKQGISTTVSKQRVLCKSTLLQSKNDGKGDNSGKGEKEKDARPKTSTNDANPTKRNTLSQAFRTQQSVRTRKLVEEVQKQPIVLQKSKPGTYKGRVIESKIDCFRKPSGDVKTTEMKAIWKPDLTKVSKVRSKSVTSLSASIRPRLNSALTSRPKSVSDVPQHVAEKPVQKSVSQKPVQKSVSQKHIPLKVPGSVRPEGPRQVRAPPRPAPLTTGRLVASKPIASKKNEAAIQRAKPKPAVANPEQKVCRPVTSTVSKYRMQMETADERRAKLADWLASNGKTKKRPTILETLPTNSRKPFPMSKPGPKATSFAQPKPVTQPESVKPAREKKPDSQIDDIKVSESKPVQSNRQSNILNTTLDLLDNSDMDLPVNPEIRMESVVLNLCDKLEAMETPSSYTDADELEGERMEVLVEAQETDRVFEIVEEEELEEDEYCKEAAVKHEDKAAKEKKPYESEDSEEEKSTTTPEMEGASIVKYSVKTTPYLQSVKKRIECQSAPGSGSRHRSTIKDLKFLTPVRRSTRIQRKSSRLPGMLNDHDTCVSSLAELVQLEDADANAYIYRKNPALMEDLPDHPVAIGKVCS
ncbi:Cytoskeleton-associated protein 2 [Triplophysa tibetana]|uniref:Cytoskeleton-associated protein 2 n=1 Tax=Triplophysa tibetana TaxID=1572043 RepID=A0A5A9N1X8_9TELE|nr:Cytoskeleton-associated protein 2 [Triplophysa tibetana]